MAPQAITSSSSPLSSAVHKTSTKNFSNLQSEDFFGLLIAQLQSQDPLKPTDNQTLLNQISSIRQMEQSSTLTKTLTNLSAEQRFGAASSLIGRYVAGKVQDQNGNNFVVKGVVTGVHFDDNGRAILELHDGNFLPADKVDEVTVLQNLPQDVQQAIVDGQSDPTAAATTAAQRAITTNAATAAARGQPAPDEGLVGGVLRALFGSTSGATVGI